METVRCSEFLKDSPTTRSLYQAPVLLYISRIVRHLYSFQLRRSVFCCCFWLVNLILPPSSHVLYILQSVEYALQALKATNTDIFYRQHSWQLIKCFLVSAVNLDDDKITLQHLLLHHKFQDGNIQNLSAYSTYECTDTHIRSVMQQALCAMFGRCLASCLQL